MRALFAGTFDPITLGHQDILERAQPLCERLWVAVYGGADSQRRVHVTWPFEQRLAAANAVCAAWKHVEVVGFTGLLVDEARALGANVLLRGVRNAHDWDWENQLACANHRLEPKLATLWLPSSPGMSDLQASFVRDIRAHGGDIRPFLPEVTHNILLEG